MPPGCPLQQAASRPPRTPPRGARRGGRRPSPVGKQPAGRVEVDERRDADIAAVALSTDLGLDEHDRVRMCEDRLSGTVGIKESFLRPPVEPLTGGRRALLQPLDEGDDVVAPNVRVRDVLRAIW